MQAAGLNLAWFGAITTLIVWQQGKLEVFEVFSHFLPSLVNGVVPVALMYAAVPNEEPAPVMEKVQG